MPTYDRNFYAKEQQACRESARIVVPIVQELLHARSVVDVGCGVGTWLSVFGEHGATELLGIDGDYVDRSQLEVPGDRFLAADLTRPPAVARTFDLVVSLEVAEHLPATSADPFVEFLTGLGPAVLFSAAIPFQGGVHHVNEQWADYWSKRFARHGHAPVDCVRPRVWDDARVLWYYAQNMILYVRPELLETNRPLCQQFERTRNGQLSIVHPRKYLDTVESMRRLAATAADLARLIPPGGQFVCADQEEFRSTIAGGYRAMPFLEHEGQYWGPPADGETAIREMERLRKTGAEFFVLGWTAFWWLDYYADFAAHLTARYRRILDNERLIVFDLRTDNRPEES